MSRKAACILLGLLLIAASGCGTAGENGKESSKTAQKEPGTTGSRPPKQKESFLTGKVVGLQNLTVMKVDAGPKSVELMPGGRRLFVNDLYAKKCFIFDADDYTQLKVIGLPDEPVEADFSNDGRFAWVSLYNSAKVLVLDTEAGVVAGEALTGSIPKEVAVSPDGKWVYAANWDSNTVTVIDAKARARVTDIPMEGTPRGICFSKKGDFAYVCIMGGDTVAEINVAAQQVSRQIPCGSNPRHVVLSDDGNTLYVSNNAPGTVTVVDRVAGGIIASIKVGKQARTIALTPDGRYLFVCNYGDGTVGCVDLVERTEVFEVPSFRAIGLAVSARGDRLFVANYAPPQVAVMQIVRE